MPSTEEMRKELLKEYPWPRWEQRVKKMSDAQVYATWTRIQNKKREKR